MLFVIYVSAKGYQKGYGSISHSSKVVSAHDLGLERSKPAKNVKQRIACLKMSKSARKRLSDADVLRMRELHKQGRSATELGREFNCSTSYAHAITSGQVRSNQ